MSMCIHHGQVAPFAQPPMAGIGMQPNLASPQAKAAIESALTVLMTAAATLIKMLQEQQSQSMQPGGMPFGGMQMSPFGMPQMPAMPGMNFQPQQLRPTQQGLPANAPQSTAGVQQPTGSTPSNGAPKAGVPSGVPGDPGTVPQRNDKPTDPSKTVDDYLDANNGVLRKLGNQEGMKDKLKARYGDWDDPKRSEAERKQSAYNAARHVGVIKNMKDVDGNSRGDVHTNGKMEGCTKDGDIRSGTEMAVLKDSLKTEGKGQDHNTNELLGKDKLPGTNNARDAKYVRKNGTNRDTIEVVGREIGQFFLKGISKVFEVLSSIVGNTLGRIPGIGKLLSAPAEALFGTISNYSKAGADIVGKDLQGNEKKEALDTAGRESAGGAAGAFVGIVDPTGALSGITDNAVQHAIAPDKVAFDPGKAALNGMDPTGGLITGT
jgi:hypothetical protein